MAFGVLAGTKKPPHTVMSRFGKPASTAVGTLGSADERTAVVTTMPLSLFAFTSEHRRRQRHHRELGLVRHRGGERLRRARERNMREAHVRQRAEVLEHQVRRAAGARRAVVQVARLGELHQILHRIDLQLGRGRHDDRLRRHARDRLQVAQRIEPRIGVHQLRDDHRVGGDQHVVAVRLDVGDVASRDQSGRAAAVLDHDGLPQHRAQLVGEQPRHRVDAATRREAHDQAHGARRIAVLRRRGAGSAKSASAARA